MCEFDEFCPIGDMHNTELSKDPAPNMHCSCWYDGDGCCRCKFPAMTTEEKIAQGMED